MPVDHERFAHAQRSVPRALRANDTLTSCPTGTPKTPASCASTVVVAVPDQSELNTA
jgi:hypothetical protein